jgi:hypothetical protein
MYRWGDTEGKEGPARLFRAWNFEGYKRLVFLLFSLFLNHLDVDPLASLARISKQVPWGAFKIYYIFITKTQSQGEGKTFLTGTKSLIMDTSGKPFATGSYCAIIDGILT